jgi:integrase
VENLYQTKNNNYYIKFRVNKKLIPYFNKSFVTKSLNTKCFKKAKEKASIIQSKYQKILEVSTMLSKEHIQQIINSYIQEELEQDLKERVEFSFGTTKHSLTPDKHSEDLDMIDEVISTTKEELAFGNIETMVSHGEQLLLNHGIEYNGQDKSHQMLVYLLKQATITILEEIRGREVGNFDSKYTFGSDSTSNKPNNKLISIDTAYEKFEKWYSATGITKKQYNGTINKLTNIILPFFRDKKFISTITLDDLDEFKEFLETYPNTNLKPYNTMSYKEIVALKEIPEKDLITISTQEKYLKIIKQFFSFQHDNGYVEVNPCKRLIMPNSKVTSRDAFTKDDMKILFREIDNLEDDRKYIYYTLAYTGMRPSEFWKCSISEDDGIYYFDLTSDDIDLKTQTSRRKIPLHSKLIKYSLHAKLYKLQKEYKQASISNYFNRTIKKNLKDHDNKLMYSFRHTVATELKRAEVMMDKVSEILGHSYEGSNMTKEVYAKGYTLQQLKEAIECLRFD